MIDIIILDNNGCILERPRGCSIGLEASVMGYGEEERRRQQVSGSTLPFTAPWMPQVNLKEEK